MLNSKRILLVEDEPLLCEIYQETLSEAGFLVETAVDGNAALDKLRLYEYDLVLLDVMLPGKDGYQILNNLQEEKRLDKHGKIVLMSNLDQNNLTEEGSVFGINDILIKSDLAPNEFLEKVKEFLQ